MDQLIASSSKDKRLDWARTYINDDFNDVEWTDETTVQIETHKRYCYSKDIPNLAPNAQQKFVCGLALAKMLLLKYVLGTPQYVLGTPIVYILGW